MHVQHVPMVCYHGLYNLYLAMSLPFIIIIDVYKCMVYLCHIFILVKHTIFFVSNAILLFEACYQTHPDNFDLKKIYNIIILTACVFIITGYYCLANSTEYTDKPCPVGHYCPSGTTSSMEFPCWSGSFNPHEYQTNNTACEPCTPGMYCMGNGLQQPTSNCRSVLAVTPLSVMLL